MKTKTIELTVDFGKPNSDEAHKVFEGFWGTGTILSAREKENIANEAEVSILENMLFAMEGWTEDAIGYEMRALRDALKQRKASLEKIIEAHCFVDDEDENGKTRWSEEFEDPTDRLDEE